MVIIPTLLLLWPHNYSTYITGDPRAVHQAKHTHTHTPHFLQGKELNPLSFKLKVRPQGSRGQGPVGRIHVLWMEAENPQKT